MIVSFACKETEKIWYGLRLPYLSMQQIIQGKFPMTADIDLRLCRYFGSSDGYFLRLHYAHKLMEAKRNLGEILS